MGGTILVTTFQSHSSELGWVRKLERRLAKRLHAGWGRMVSTIFKVPVIQGFGSVTLS